MKTTCKRGGGDDLFLSSPFSAFWEADVEGRRADDGGGLADMEVGGERGGVYYNASEMRAATEAARKSLGGRAVVVVGVGGELGGQDEFPTR